MHSLKPTGSWEGQWSCKYWLWLGAGACARPPQRAVDARKKIDLKGWAAHWTLTDATGLGGWTGASNDQRCGKFVGRWYQKPRWLAPHESNAWFFSHVGKGYCTDNTSPYAPIAHFFVACHTSHNSSNAPALAQDV